MDESVHIMIILPLLFIGWYLISLLPTQELNEGRVALAAEIAARETEKSLTLPLVDPTCGSNAACIARHNAALAQRENAARREGAAAARRRLALICRSVDVEIHPERPARITGAPQIAALVTCDGETASYIYDIP